MHADDQHFLVVRAVEDADAAALGQRFMHRQRKSWSSSSLDGALNENLAALRVDAGHHVLDGAVLPGGVHRLEDSSSAQRSWA